MRVILVGPTYPYRGGIAHHTQFLDQALQELGHQTMVISFQRQFPALLYPGKTDKDPSHRQVQANTQYLLDPIKPLTWLQAARTIAAIQPDLVAFQWWTTFWGIPFAFLSSQLRRKEIPCVYIIHNVLPHEARPWDAWLARQALSRGAAFLAQTSQEKARLLALIPGANAKVCAIPIYKMATPDKPSRSQARQRLGLPDEEMALLFFGLVRPYKGLHYLLEAMGILRQAGIQPFLIIAGEFWQDKNSYLRQIQDLQLSQQVQIEDRYIPDEEVEWYFSAADLLVAPYVGGTTQSAVAKLGRGFNIPMIITEEVAHSFGKSPPYGVRVVPAADSQALAQAIQAACENPQLIKELPPIAVDEWEAFAQVLLSTLCPQPGKQL